MRILTSRSVGRIGKLLVVTTLIRALVVPMALPASAAEVLVAELNGDVVLTDAGKAVRTDGLKLATVAGNALISPAMPATDESALPETPLERGSQRVRQHRVRVPAGTTFRVVVTGYSSTPDQTDSSPFITASGTRVHDGTLAANFLPMGTRITFPGYAGTKVFIVEDRTNPKYSSRADIWFSSRVAALEFGKRTLRMVVVD